MKFKPGNLIRATADAIWRGTVIDDRNIMLIVERHPAESPKEIPGLTFPAYYIVLIGESLERRNANYIEDSAEIIG